MELELSIHIDKQGNPHLADTDRPYAKEFYEKHKDQWATMILKDNDESRTSTENRHYWADLGYFVPDNFNSTDEAHEHFTQQFLSRESVFDYSDMAHELEKIMKKARRILSTRIIEDKVEVKWVRSTASLTQKQFIEYRNNVEREGSKLGIQFQQ